MNMSRIYRYFRFVFRAALTAAIALLLVFNVYTLTARLAYGDGMPRFLGYSFATVMSDSMADEIRAGDLIITKEMSSYGVGDVITFYDSQSNTYITHRIVLASGDTYATKGDANNAADNFSVPKSAVVGKVVAVLKGFGNTVTFLQSPYGLLCAVGAFAALWIISGAVGKVIEKKKK